MVTTQDRAAAVVGDLLEEPSSGGGVRFWWTVAGATLAFAWLNFVRFVTGRRALSSGADNRGQFMDFWRFVWSRKWLLVVPVVLCTIATSLVAYSMPVMYRSETRIIVVPQRVPEAFIPSSVTTSPEDRLRAIKQRVFSRARLERVVMEFNLYEEARKHQIMEDVIQAMRDDIEAEIMPGRAGGEPPVLRVSFQSANPRTTMRVTERLASLFIEENLNDRANLAEGTDRFLEAQLKDIARQVDEFASRMERYRLVHRTSPRSEVLEYEELQNTYRDLLGKRQQARIAANMERRQIGEQFKLLDAARIPERPEGPERLSLSLFGTGIGLGVGLLLLLAASMRKPTPPQTISVASPTLSE